MCGGDGSDTAVPKKHIIILGIPNLLSAKY